MNVLNLLNQIVLHFHQHLPKQKYLFILKSEYRTLLYHGL